MEELISAHKHMMCRYKSIIQAYDPALLDQDYLVNFCNAAQMLTNPDKLSRWVGFIQGTLIERTIIDTDVERNYSREIYKPIYNKLGYDSSTVDVD